MNFLSIFSFYYFYFFSVYRSGLPRLADFGWLLILFQLCSNLCLLVYRHACYEWVGTLLLYYLTFFFDLNINLFYVGVLTLISFLSSHFLVFLNVSQYGFIFIICSYLWEFCICRTSFISIGYPLRNLLSVYFFFPLFLSVIVYIDPFSIPCSWLSRSGT